VREGRSEGEQGWGRREKGGGGEQRKGQERKGMEGKRERGRVGEKGGKRMSQVYH